jgi:CAAX prenyl protease-like protein
VLLCPGCFAAALEVHSRWLGGRLPILEVYAGALAVTAAWGLLVVGVDVALDTSAIGLASGVAVGVATGGLGFVAERAIVRRTVRRKRFAVRTGPRSPWLPADGRSGRRLSALGELSRGESAALPTVIAVGCLEEVVYRGALNGVCMLVAAAPLRVAALAGATVVFAVSHVWFGWSHVLGKLPFSAAATASVVALDSLLTAVVAHVVLNAAVWRVTRGARRGRDPLSGALADSLTRRPA